MNSAKTKLVHLFAGQRLKIHRISNDGEESVLRAEFTTAPWVSVHSASSKSGAFVCLKGLDLEAELKAWLVDLKAALNEPIANLQVKFILHQENESQIRRLCQQMKISEPILAVFPAGENLECLFYPSSGRMRVAPMVAPAALADQKPKVVALKSANSRQTSLQFHRKARVLIVDDSKTMRQLLKKIIAASPDLEVVGEAERPSQVRQLIESLKPDVMTLDINMPEMSGVELLRGLLPSRFIATVMISSIGLNEGHEVLEALELGAIDYIQKPAADEMAVAIPLIHEKILQAAQVKAPLVHQPQVAENLLHDKRFTSSRLIAVGASTGGTEAIKNVFIHFPAEVPPIVVVQHIPPYFSTAFANRLNELCQFEVREAQDGDKVLPGLALIAPGGLHLEVKKEKGVLIARLSKAELVNRFRPSVDVLFHSVAQVLGNQATGVLMTGMGNDGAKGLLEMKNAGCHTIAQDEKSSVVYGMPRAAAELGAATEIRALDDIARALMKAA